MPLSDDDAATLARLQIQIRKASLRGRLMDMYYDGEQRVEQLGLAIPPELRRFLTIAAWPGTYADAIEERIDLEGFRLPGAADADAELWRIWQANGLDEESQLAHLDAIVREASYVVVGAGDGNPDAPSEADRDPALPLITVESSDEVGLELSPRTRRVSAAAKFYQDGSTSRATLYLPDRTSWLERRNARWEEVERDEHDLGVVPVVPLANRPRLSRRGGRSQLHRVIGLTDAAARALTNAQMATEALAVPQRWIVGASRSDFVDAEGNVLPVWETYFGAILALANKDAKMGQFNAADLANFSGIVSHYAGLVAGVTGLPMRYLGQSTTNPPSADGIRADENRIIKTCERFHRVAGGSWELVMRLARRLIDGDWDPGLAQLETQWRNPATPTRAQEADAAVKLVQAGILPVEAAWEDLGYSAGRRERLRELRDDELARDPVRALTGQLNTDRGDQAEPAQAPAGDDAVAAG